MNIFSGQDAADIFQHYHEIISKESDRGAVLVAAALLDFGLEAALKKKLVLSVESKDPLFNNGNSPFSTFSSKIELSFRLGLITEQTKQMLNIFRKLRNDFAHSVDICTFSEERVKDRLMAAFDKHTELYSAVLATARVEFNNLSRNNKIYESSENPLDGPQGVRIIFDCFFASTAMALSRLEHAIERIKELK